MPAYRGGHRQACPPLSSLGGTKMSSWHSCTSQSLRVTPITRAPSLNTGHSHSTCLFPGPLSQQIQEQVRSVPLLGWDQRIPGSCLSLVQHFRLTSFRPLPPVFCYIYAHLPQVPLIQGWLCPSNVFWMSVLPRDKVSTHPISFQGGDARSPW